MECNINYPGGEFVQHIIQWQKQGIEVPIFMKFNGYPPHIDPTFSNRVRLIEKATIEISEIRKSDEGWYECKIIFLDGMDESKVNGTWIYLSVNGKSYCLICPRKDCIVFWNVPCEIKGAVFLHIRNDQYQLFIVFRLLGLFQVLSYQR